MFSCLPGWIFISDNTSHSNNQVNHYLQQIHEHYDAYYVQNDFGHIGVLTVWADNCSEQFKSRYQLGWSVLYVNKTSLQIIHLFFFCPQHGKGPLTGLAVTVKMLSKQKRNLEDISLLRLMSSSGCSKTSLLYIHPALVCLQFGKESFALSQTELFLAITS